MAVLAKHRIGVESGGWLSPMDYYRLGQSYPRTQNRMAYPRVCRYLYVAESAEEEATIEAWQYTSVVKITTITKAATVCIITTAPKISNQYKENDEILLVPLMLLY